MRHVLRSHVRHGCGTGNLVTKKPHRKRQLQDAARLFCSLQMPQVPPLGERKCSDTAVINADSQVAGANMVQLEHLKVLLSSLDPIILKQLLVGILKE